MYNTHKNTSIHQEINKQTKEQKYERTNIDVLTYQYVI